MNAMNGVIYIDEIDKLSDQSADVASALMHILDESQNSEWYDKYFGDVPMDLSGIFWVMSINEREKIPPILRDRLHIMSVPDPSLTDKVETAKRILIPDLMEIHGLQIDEIEFPKEIISNIILTKTRGEKGLRALKQCIEAIIQRTAYLKHTLLTLPPAAIWHAAKVSAELGIQYSAPPISTREERDEFAKQTSFYFDGFKVPLILNQTNMEKLLEYFKPSENLNQHMYI
jgi:ATP-dependent Lon protease